ncbi:MAG TPA: heme exporter protein CcmD [Xanthobacteraceae bacterium]|nr:heme exporter protein CcmD [Xanthobacteraceae bacterium]
MLGEHGAFILAAYLSAILVLGALAAVILLDGRRLRRELAEMEARGLTRRSAGQDDGR